MQTGTREQAKWGLPSGSAIGAKLDHSRDQARAEEEAVLQAKESSTKKSNHEQQTRPTEALEKHLWPQTPHMLPQVTNQWPGRAPLKGPVSQPSHPGCGRSGSSLSRDQRQMQDCSARPLATWLPSSPAHSAAENSVAGKLRRHSISFQINHSFFFFFFPTEEEKSISLILRLFTTLTHSPGYILVM